MKFRDWLRRMEETSTSTADVAVFARPFLTGARRMYPEPLTYDDDDKRKRKARKVRVQKLPPL